MRIGSTAALCVLASFASAQEPLRPTALLVTPIHEAQVVRGDDGMDHVEYELLVVSVFAEPVTLSSVAVLGPAGEELMRIEGDALAAATQTLFAKTASPVVPASAAVSVDVDLILPPDIVPERVTHRIAYALAPDTESAVMIGVPEIDGPEVAIDRRPAMVIAPPVAGDGWLVATACCTPNVHRDLRAAIDGRRIATAETFAVDWNRVRNGRIFDGDGSSNEQHYIYGADVLAVADGTVVAIQGHLQPGSLTVKVGDTVTAGARLARVGNTGPSFGPHLHFGLLDKPNLWAGRSLPFVFDRYTLVGVVDMDSSEGDGLVISPDGRQVRSAYPLVGGIHNYP
jgi:hypothetical protein